MQDTRLPSSLTRTAVPRPPRPPAPYAIGVPRLRATQESALPSPGHPPPARETLFAPPRSARGCPQPRSPQPGCRRPGLRGRCSGRSRPRVEVDICGLVEAGNRLRFHWYGTKRISTSPIHSSRARSPKAMQSVFASGFCDLCEGAGALCSPSRYHFPQGGRTRRRQGAQVPFAFQSGQRAGM